MVAGHQKAFLEGYNSKYEPEGIVSAVAGAVIIALAMVVGFELAKRFLAKKEVLPCHDKSWVAAEAARNDDPNTIAR